MEEKMELEEKICHHEDGQPIKQVGQVPPWLEKWRCHRWTDGKQTNKCMYVREAIILKKKKEFYEKRSQNGENFSVITGTWNCEESPGDSTNVGLLKLLMDSLEVEEDYESGNFQ